MPDEMPRAEEWPKLHFYAAPHGSDIDLVLAGPDDVVCLFFGHDADARQMAKVALDALNESLITAGLATREHIDSADKGLAL